MKSKRYQLTVTLQELQYIYDGLALQYSTFFREHMLFSSKRTEARLVKFDSIAMPLAEHISKIEGIRH